MANIRGWQGQRMPTSSWKVRISESQIEEISSIAEYCNKESIPPEEISSIAGSCGSLKSLACDITDRLKSGMGMVVVSGFPTAESSTLDFCEFRILCRLLGEPVGQNEIGDLYTRIEDTRSSSSRGYQSSVSLPWHVDPVDVVALLCVRPAQSGGTSRVASSKNIAEILSIEAPEAFSLLKNPFPAIFEPPREGNLGARLPIFIQSDNGNSLCWYTRQYINLSRILPGCRLSHRMISALDSLDEILERPGISLDFSLEPGDIQIMNNFSVLHTRSEFAENEMAKRLLVRSWISTSWSQQLPDNFLPFYGSVAAGSVRGGRPIARSSGRLGAKVTTPTFVNS